MKEISHHLFRRAVGVPSGAGILPYRHVIFYFMLVCLPNRMECEKVCSGNKV